MNDNKKCLDGGIEWSRVLKKALSLYYPKGAEISEALRIKGILGSAQRAV